MKFVRFAAKRRRRGRNTSQREKPARAKKQTARPANRSSKKPAARRAKKGGNRRQVRLWQRLPDVKAWFNKLAPAVTTGTKRMAPTMVTAILVGAIAVGGYVGYRWLTTSAHFAAKHIVVDGNDRVAVAEVERTLAIPTGTNIFSIDLGLLELKLESKSWIKSASVTRQLPNTLKVMLVEHKAAAVVQMDGLYLADAEGNLFKRAVIARGEGAGLPVVTGIPRGLYVRLPKLARADIRRAMEIARTYKSGAKRPRLGEIHLNSRRSFTLFTYDSGLEIRVGRGETTTIASRLRFFDHAWKTLDSSERARAQTIYVDNTTRPDRVTVGFRN